MKMVLTILPMSIGEQPKVSEQLQRVAASLQQQGISCRLEAQDNDGKVIDTAYYPKATQKEKKNG